MDIAKLICANTQDEGFGAVYERIMLEKLLLRLYKQYDFKSILEYGCRITKGYDNLAFLINEKCEVAVADKDIERIKDIWKFEAKPDFNNMDIDKKFELVWNFAVVQLEPHIIKEMKKRSSRYILFFTPNIWNYGTPFHIIYHLISRTKCNHAEQGKIILRRRKGLEKVARINGLEVIESGYVDMPWWPDTAFSIREFKQNFLHHKVPPLEKIKPKDVDEYLKSIEKMMFIENGRLFLPIKHFFAHHTFVFARIK